MTKRLARNAALAPLTFCLLAASSPAQADFYACYRNGQVSMSKQRLAGCIRVLSAPTTEGSATSSEPTRQSATGNTSHTDTADIRWVQQRLQSLGYNPGPADGLVGSKTTAAVRRYQQDQGLVPTGRITSQLIQTLR